MNLFAAHHRKMMPDEVKPKFQFHEATDAGEETLERQRNRRMRVSFVMHIKYLDRASRISVESEDRLVAQQIMGVICTALTTLGVTQ